MSFDTDMRELQAQYQHKRVRIKKGATVIRRMQPRNDQWGAQKLGRTIVVECHSVYPAYEYSEFTAEPPVQHPAQLTYAGSGGYWVDIELDPEFVEVVK